MTAEQAGEQVVTRIGFAERWLERARGQVVAGNLTRGVLTLVLADAEVHHALEVVGARPVRRASLRRALGPAGLAAAALAAIAAMALATNGGSVPPAASDPPPSVVRLPWQAGALLDLVLPASPPPAVTAAPAAIPPVPVRGTFVRRPAPGGSLAPAVPSLAAPAAAAAPAASPAAPLPGSGPAPATVQAVPPAAVPVLMAGELIDLVLAAERTLRSDSVRR